MWKLKRISVKMGNQPGSHSKGGVVIEETLESMQKEKQRDDHLKNLEFKRSKSIRRSIAKRLKGGKKRNHCYFNEMNEDGKMYNFW